MNSSNTILLVEDDAAVYEVVVDYLSTNGFTVNLCKSGAETEEKLAGFTPDLALVDLGLPDADGLELVRKIQAHCDAGIIILTGRGETTEKIVGLELGADDYITKPFDLRELVARIRSVLRRKTASENQSETSVSSLFRFDDWLLDIDRRELTSPEGTSVKLSSGEFEILKAFVENPNKVLSRDQLMDLAYYDSRSAYDRSVDIRISRIRKKIETDAAMPRMIKTIRNAGYMFSVPVDRV